MIKDAVIKAEVKFAADNTVAVEELMSILASLPRWVVLCNPLDRDACQEMIDQSDTPGLFELVQSRYVPENVRYVVRKDLTKTRFMAYGEVLPDRPGGW